VTSAKNILGIGPGSKYAPVKANIVMDDEDENEDYGHEFLPEGEGEEEEKLGNDDIQNEHFGPPEEVIQE